MKIMIGIDTGVKTGFAVAADRGKGGELEQVESLSITQAMSKVKDSVQTWGAQNVCLYIEDARQRTWFRVAVKRLRALDRSSEMPKYGKTGVRNKATCTR